MKSEGNQLPLDIHHAKLAEWLVNRQKLPRDFHKKLQVIQAKAAKAAEDLPQEMKTQAPITDETALDYSTAVSNRDTLAKTSEKTLFGGLTGQAGLWDKIVRAYEQDNIFLGECSLLLARNVAYEIPFLQRQAAKQQQQLVDLERKQSEHLHSAVMAARAYQQDCEGMGIKGGSVRGELLARVKELPGIFHDIVQQLQSGQTRAAMEHYATFVSQTLTKAVPHTAADLLPTLHHMCTSDLSAEPEADMSASLASSQTHELAGQAPLSDTATSAGHAESALAEGQRQDEGLEPPSSSSSMPMEISWDVYVAAEDAQAADASGAAEIDWDVDVAGADAGDPAGGMQIDWGTDGDRQASDAAPEEQTGGIVSQLLCDASLRGYLLDELYELLSFLQSRSQDMASTQNSAFLVSVTDMIEDTSSAGIQAWLQELLKVIGQLTEERTQQLLLFKTSERYLDRVTAALQQKASQEAKFRRLAQEVEGRRQQVQAVLSRDASKLTDIIARTRSIKALVEDALTAQLNRKVIVMGEINNVLA